MKQFIMGYKLESKERVIFFDGSVSSEFPKIGKITKQLLNKVDTWLITNAYNVAERNGDLMLVYSLKSDLLSKKIPQATKDLAECYLAGELEVCLSSGGVKNV